MEHGANFLSLRLEDIREVDWKDEANEHEHSLTHQDHDITYDGIIRTVPRGINEAQVSF